jgi:16S rRNA (uracil1498-N3)-methyltransferase
MSLHRFFLSTKNITENILSIFQPEYHHIVDVLRYKEGDNIILFDGEGKEYYGVVVSVDNEAKVVKVDIRTIKNEETLRPLILAQSMIKASNMDLIVQKATELGVTHIYPLFTKNSVIKIEGKQALVKVDKWKRTAEEASKQCGRSWLPHIDRIWSFDAALEALDKVNNKIICAISSEAKKLKEVSDIDRGSTAVMIGPEGDFTSDEVKKAIAYGWQPVNLGKTILRAETAAISALGVLSYKFGYWD